MMISVVIAAFSQILLKKSAQKRHDSIICEYINPYVITGYIMLAVSTAITMLAYRGMEYKNGPIIESLGYILVMLLSWIFFKEAIVRKKILGNLLILLGIFIFYL
jgi:drug/metabolite transporter (DMT)-like permease